MSLGQQLRQERERRGISLADIAKETCIGKRHLEAIESGDTKTMPRDFFYRSFVRQYSQFLGLDAKDIEAGLDLEMGVTTTPAAMAAAAAASGAPSGRVKSILTPAVAKPAAAKPALFAERVARPADPSPRIFLQESRTSAPWLILAGLLLAGSISYLAWDRVSGAVTTAVKQPIPAATRTVAEPVALATAPPTITATSPNGTVVEATKLPSGSLKLIISAKEPAWIQLDADGKALFVGLLEAGQSREVENAQEAKLLTGNAGGIEVLQNGKPITGLGSRGEVRTVVFSHGEYQVIRPAIKTEPAPETKTETPKSDTSPVAE